MNPTRMACSLMGDMIASPLVLLLHGFPQLRHSWREQVPAVGAAGYRAIAPDQRGYSPGIATDLAAETLRHLAREGIGLEPAAQVGILGSLAQTLDDVPGRPVRRARVLLAPRRRVEPPESSMALPG